MDVVQIRVLSDAGEGKTWAQSGHNFGHKGFGNHLNLNMLNYGAGKGVEPQPGIENT